MKQASTGIGLLGRAMMTTALATGLLAAPALAQTSTAPAQSSPAPAQTSTAPAQTSTTPAQPPARRDLLLMMQQNPTNWVMPGKNYANWRFSRLTQINAGNAGHLQVSWMFSTGALRGHEGAPLVIGDIMYVHTPFPNIVYALNLNNGRILWKYQPQQDAAVAQMMCCDTVNRGLSAGDHKILLQQADTTVVALDAQMGKVVWSVKDGDPTKGQTGTGAPLVAKDKVIVGVSGGDDGVRGWVSAYNLSDGKLAWRAYSEGPDADMLVDPQKTTSLGKPIGADSSLKSWQGDQWKTGGGESSGWFSYDPRLNLVYYGSGGPSPWNPVQRPGDNKWTATIFARDLNTGMAKWVYQMTPHDQWGYSGTNEMILANAHVNGRAFPTLVHFDSNGFAYTLDRETGQLLLAAKFDPSVNWASKVDMDPNSATFGQPQVVPQYAPGVTGENKTTNGICPSALGAKSEQPAAFSPVTGLFYVPTNHLCMDFEPTNVTYTSGQTFVGATVSVYPGPGGNMGNVIAWDAREGRVVWSIPERFPVWSGVLATAGDVVFYGTLSGYLKAVDARTGRQLYSFKTSIRYRRQRHDVFP